MHEGDAARKRTLVEHGFRLPSAMDNRPLKFAEFLDRCGQKVYLSATPGKYELEKTNNDEFIGCKWDISQLKGYKKGRGSALPFAVSLTELMQVKEKK